MKQTVPFSGNIGRDPELKIERGQALLKFSIRHSHFVNVNAGTDEQPDFQEKVGYWADCAMWGKEAEQAHKFLRKGTSVTGNAELSINQLPKTDDNEAVTFINYRILSIGIQPHCIESVAFKPKRPHADSDGVGSASEESQSEEATS